jgi:hypothetical protein
MLISMPTGTSTIFGVFQDISNSFSNGRLSRPRVQGNAVLKVRQLNIWQRFLAALQKELARAPPFRTKVRPINDFRAYKRNVRLKFASARPKRIKKSCEMPPGSPAGTPDRVVFIHAAIFLQHPHRQ